MRKFVWVLPLVLVLATVAGWADGFGPKVGERLQPFTCNVVTGKFRGQQHCFVCSLIQRPGLLVFARHMDEPTARLLRGVNAIAHDNTKDNLESWFVFLGLKGARHETDLATQAEAYAGQNQADFVAVTVLGDPEGPPGYLLSSKIDVLVIATQARKILSSHVFEAAQWNDHAADQELASLQSELHLK